MSTTNTSRFSDVARFFSDNRTDVISEMLDAAQGSGSCKLSSFHRPSVHYGVAIDWHVSRSTSLTELTTGLTLIPTQKPMRRYCQQRQAPSDI